MTRRRRRREAGCRKFREAPGKNAASPEPVLRYLRVSVELIEGRQVFDADEFCIAHQADIREVESVAGTITFDVESMRAGMSDVEEVLAEHLAPPAAPCCGATGSRHEPTCPIFTPTGKVALTAAQLGIFRKALVDDLAVNGRQLRPAYLLEGAGLVKITRYRACPAIVSVTDKGRALGVLLPEES